MSNAVATFDTVTVSPRCGFPVEFVRNEYGVIIDTFGDVSNKGQCITVNVVAHRDVSHFLADPVQGEVDQEIIRLQLPLTGPIKPMIESYISAMLPLYWLHSWCVWPGDASYNEPKFVDVNGNEWMEF